ALAAEGGLLPEPFGECLDSGRYEEVLNADFAEAQQLGITGVPTFFVNGRLVLGAQPFSVFQRIIDNALPVD
ncbi:MAG: DsbA family protein, partial [Chloroflexi bacterium]|nr:DsbA family protein [Chloroflexota bacterium]